MNVSYIERFYLNVNYPQSSQLEKHKNGNGNNNNNNDINWM